jgi:phage FluMu protein gp41
MSAVAVNELTLTAILQAQMVHEKIVTNENTPGLGLTIRPNKNAIPP